jgi:hypothetical protein
MAFTFYRAKKDGRKDGRSLGQTHTHHKRDVLDCRTAQDLFDLVTTEGRKNWRYYRAEFKRMTAGQWDAFAEVYPIARDYLIDQIGE